MWDSYVEEDTKAQDTAEMGVQDTAEMEDGIHRKDHSMVCHTHPH